MFDNVAFEVVIGLVFIYLLYSLLATIVGEIISTACGIRQRLLRIAIERMFNDGYYTKIERSAERYINFLRKWWLDVKGWARKVLLYEPEEFKTSFAGKFYEYPAIKYLGRIEEDHKGLFSSTKPAYITPEYFADTLINFLREKGSGATDMDRIGFCLKFNTYHIQPKTLKQFRNLFENAATNKDAYRQNLMKWFNETMDRNNGWYKRKMRSILFWLAIVLAVAFNIDSIRIAKILAKDKEARGQLVSLGIELSKDSARYKDFVAGNGDTIQSKAVLDSGFAHVTKDLNAANLVLGLGWQFDTLRKEEQYIASSKDSGIFKSLLDNQQSFQNLTTERNDVLNKIQERKDAILAKSDSIQLFVPDTLLDDINNIERRIRQLLFENKHDSSTYVKNSKNSKKLLAQTNTITKSKFENITAYKTNKNHDSIIITGVRKYTGYEKFRYFFVAIFCRYRWIGFILTALALCLGAPFWFGVLNKLVSIRGVGVNPEEKNDKGEKKTTSSILNPVELSVDIQEEKLENLQEAALNELTFKLRDENGVVAIAIITTGIPHLLVMSETAEINNYLLDKYGNVQNLSTGFSIAIVYESQPPIVTHEGSIGGEIANETEALGFGTLGCFLKKKDSNDIYITSCWHVLKDNPRYNEAFIKTKIVAKDSAGNLNHIAELEEGVLADTIDVGFARCLNDTIEKNDELIIKKQYRNITAFDQLSGTPVTLYGKVSKKRSAKVFFHKLNAQLTYPGGSKHAINDVFSITTVKDDGSFIAPTQPGDSGSVIIDNEGTPLGMVIGGNGIFSYAVKFSNMFGEGKIYRQYSFII